MADLPGNPAVPRDWTRGVLEQYVSGSDTRGLPKGGHILGRSRRIREISGLKFWTTDYN